MLQLNRICPYDGKKANYLLWKPEPFAVCEEHYFSLRETTGLRSL